MKEAKILTVLVLAVLFIGKVSYGQTKGTVMLPELNVGENSTVDVPITVTTDSSIGIAQFVVEYSSSMLSYVSARLGADAPSGFSVSNTNPDLPFEPTTPGTDENVLVQVSGGGSNTFSGSDLEIVVLEFDLVGNYGDSSPLAFDEGVTKTYLSTVNLYDIAGSELEFINGSVNYSLPVELATFQIVTGPDNAILKWSTESETNNFGFQILRKKDGSNFMQIGFVPGYGTTTSHHDYQYFDENLSSGTYYYQLKQIDADGSFSFSEVKSAEITGMMDFLLERNYPNPFNQSTLIHYQIGSALNGTRVKLNVYSITGKLVRTLVNERQASGRYSVLWDGRDDHGNAVVSGVYFGRMIVKDKVANLKMIYVK